MPRTNEVAFNVELSNMLRTKHPRWRDHIRAEQQAVVRAAAKRPDIVIHPPGGIPVVLETEFEPARSIEEDARARLGQVLQINVVKKKNFISVCVEHCINVLFDLCWIGPYYLRFY